MSRFIFLNLQQPSEAVKQSLEHKVQHKHPKYSCLVWFYIKPTNKHLSVKKILLNSIF